MSRSIVWVVFTWLVLAKTSALTFDTFLDRCEEEGKAAGKNATGDACAVLKSKCPPPPQASVELRFDLGFELAPDQEPLDVQTLLLDALSDSCLALFRTSCKNAATKTVLEDKSAATVSWQSSGEAADKECASILRFGPGPGSDACPDLSTAIEIFQDALEVCGKADLLQLRPCVCAGDGVSAGIETGRPGCARHLKDHDDFDRFCYVVGGDLCPSAEPSNAFPGAYWTYC